MNEFVSNSIFHSSELIAQELRQARADKKISLEKAAQQTGQHWYDGVAWIPVLE